MNAKILHVRHRSHPNHGAYVEVALGGDVAGAEMRGESDAYDSAFLGAVRAAVQPVADRRQNLQRQQAAASAAMDAAAQELEQIRGAMLTARHAAFGPALDRQLATLQLKFDRAERDHGEQRVAADAAEDALTALALDAQAAVASAVEQEAVRLAGERQQTMQQLAASIAQGIADDLTAYLVARGQATALDEPRRRAGAVKAALAAAGFNQAPRPRAGLWGAGGGPR